MSTAAERWRRDLEAWAIPQHLLDAVPESPHGWPTHLWHRMQETESGESPTRVVLLDLLGEQGTLLDVGAGTGRASLPIAALGHPVTAVEPTPGMVEGLRHEAASRGLTVPVIEASWPAASSMTDRHDVVLSADVVYDVPDAAPFLEGLQAVARVGVVIEMGARHPWSPLTPYYRTLHGLERPEGPSSEDLAGVVAEVLGVEPRVQHWQSERGGLRFADLQELLDLYRRRLVLPVERRDELLDLLTPDVVEEDGWLCLARQRTEATLWWRIE